MMEKVAQVSMREDAGDYLSARLEACLKMT
jgi:hypothetical protein